MFLCLGVIICMLVCCEFMPEINIRSFVHSSTSHVIGWEDCIQTTCNVSNGALNLTVTDLLLTCIISRVLLILHMCLLLVSVSDLLVSYLSHLSSITVRICGCG